MSGFLVDTNCISELVRIRPNENVIRWFQEADEQALYLRVFTLGEIRKGISNAAPGSRQVRLESWLTIDLRQRFSKRILSVDGPVAERWGVLTGEAKRTGKTLPVVDSILAATALHTNLSIVSRNVSDFQLAGIKVIDPWLAN